MGTTQEPNALVHEYRFRWIWMAFYLAFSTIIIAGAATFLVDFAPKVHDARDVLALFSISVSFSLLGLYFALLALRSRLTVHRDSIEVHYALTNKSASVGDLEGRREVITKNANFTVLYLKTGKMALAINHAFKTDDYYKSWIDKLRDLDRLSITPQ